MPATRAAKSLISAFGVLAIMLALGLTLGSADRAAAQMGPDYWQVNGVGAGDTLNIRSGPGTKYRVVVRAGNGAVFRNLGCQGTGSQRWCNLETPDGRIRGWASGRYLIESGAPRIGAGNGSGGSAGGVPELYQRQTGEIEVRFARGCTVLFNPRGRQITGGSSCSRSQRSAAADAVDRYLREQNQGGNFEGGGSASVDVSGNGTIYGGGQLRGRIFGHREGAYAVTITSARDRLTCTGLYRYPPGTGRAQSATLHCTNGASGTATLVRNRNGRGETLTFNLSNGQGGYVLF